MPNVENLRNNYQRLSNCKTIKDSIEVLEIYSEFLFTTIQNRDKSKAGSETKEEHQARMVFQMMLTKCLHLKGIAEGISYNAKNGGKLDNIIDPTVVSCLIRNVFETVCMFNIVYAQPKNKEEKTILYCLWAHAGYAYRQKFAPLATTEANKQKMEEEKKFMIQLAKEIERTTLYKALPEKHQKKIKTRLEGKEYLLIFRDKEIKCLVWHDVPEIMGVREGLMNDIYTYFSLYSHPSNVSVFQFANMFNKGDEAFKQMTNFNLKHYFALTSIFIADYIRVFPEAKDSFDKLDVIKQITINHYNKFIRGDNYSINDSWKALEG